MKKVVVVTLEPGMRVPSQLTGEEGAIKPHPPYSTASARVNYVVLSMSPL